MPGAVKLLVPSTIQLYRRDFDRYDSNNNGVLDDEEVEKLLTMWVEIAFRGWY